MASSKILFFFYLFRAIAAGEVVFRKLRRDTLQRQQFRAAFNPNQYLLAAKRALSQRTQSALGLVQSQRYHGDKMTDRGTLRKISCVIAAGGTRLCWQKLIVSRRGHNTQ